MTPNATTRTAATDKERSVIGIAIALGAKTVSGWSHEEEALSYEAEVPSRSVVSDIRQAIANGEDPLGAALCEARSADERREVGAIYTPREIVDAMVSWCLNHDRSPARIVDPGTGSGRYIVAAGRKFSSASLVGVELDPMAALLARGHIAAAGLEDRAKVFVADYRHVRLGRIDGKTLFVGNPPYVRHHSISTEWKEWLTEKATEMGLRVSQLAGLHAHFFLATAIGAQAGDYGAFVTSAEWLDTGYGKLIRDMFVGNLGGHGLFIVEPAANPFPDAASTAVVTTFEVGSKPPSVAMKRVASLGDLSVSMTTGARRVSREKLEVEQRWSSLTRVSRATPSGFVELGELCRVHRGQATGMNDVWIAGDHSIGLPRSVLYPCVTKAKELIAAGGCLGTTKGLRDVIDIPVDLSELSAADRKAVDAFLRHAKAAGADKPFLARHRKAWWSVGMREAAPVLATYMARRPPAFVMNRANALNINVAHGIYPRVKLNQKQIEALVAHLSSATNVSDGRTYAGGLTKFEPREMERILVPGPEMLGVS